MNDIATSPDSPTAFRQLKGKEYSEKFARLQRRYYPEIAPLIVDKAPQQVFSAVRELIRRQGKWNIEFEDQPAFHLEATDKSRFFRFTDDIVIRVEPRDSGSVVQMRSRSRTGRSDFGVNAKRIRKFLGDLKATLARP